MNPIKFRASLLHPKLWPTWCAMGLWWMITQLPHRALIFLGEQLGKCLYHHNGRRVYVARTNIQKCYPELNHVEQEQLIKSNLQETAIGIFESGAAWFWPDWRFKNKYEIRGLEHIKSALDKNKGVLFLGTHFTTIEIGAAIVNLNFPISGFYRPHSNPIYEFLQAKGRTRRNVLSHVIPNNDVRGIIKALRGGAIINYAPDQDYGRRRSVFVPFFNIPTATVKAPAQLALAGKAEVIPWTTKRDKHSKKYIIEIGSPMTHLLGKGDEEDAQTINHLIEMEVRKNTRQYLWVHRRFKTRPSESDTFY